MCRDYTASAEVLLLSDVSLLKLISMGIQKNGNLNITVNFTKIISGSTDTGCSWCDKL